MNENTEAGLFEDYFEDDVTEEVADTESTESTEAADEQVDGDGGEPPEKSEEPKVKVNTPEGERELTIAEAAELASKGVQYDSIAKELETLKGGEELSLLDRLASESGMNREDYIKEMQRVQRENEIIVEQNSILGEFPDAADGLIKEIAERRVAEKHARAEGEKAEREKAEREAAEASAKRGTELFIAAYPDLDYEKDISREVWDRVRGGEDLLSAYRAEENKSLKLELETLKKNGENKERALGATKSRGNTAEDDFLAGFLGK